MSNILARIDSNLIVDMVQKIYVIVYPHYFLSYELNTKICVPKLKA